MATVTLPTFPCTTSLRVFHFSLKLALVDPSLLEYLEASQIGYPWITRLQGVQHLLRSRRMTELQ
jgi:hypothetical protein